MVAALASPSNTCCIPTVGLCSKVWTVVLVEAWQRYGTSNRGPVIHFIHSSGQEQRGIATRGPRSGCPWRRGPVYLEPVGALAQLSLGPLGLPSSGQELLQLSLHLLPSVLGLGPCLLQTLQLTRHVFVVTLQVLDELLQVAFELMQREVVLRGATMAGGGRPGGLTLLACSS